MVGPTEQEAAESPVQRTNDIEDSLETENTSSTLGRPPSWAVQIIKAERTIFEMYRRWNQGKGSLDLQPDFQRGFVWDLHKQVNLVESVLLRIPLPVVYLSEEDEERSLVIDGQQRLTTLFRFMDNEFALKNLRLLPELTGKLFRELDGKLQRRFEDTAITTFVIQPGSDPAIKFEIFQRLNQGAVELKAQEIRNCLFRGAGLTMLKELADSNGLFREVAGQNRKLDRMKADELILRCLAFLDQGPEQYRGDMLEFLNTQLDSLNRMPKEQREHLKTRLMYSLLLVKTVFGENAFRRFGDRSVNDRSPSLNAALMDILVSGFDRVQGNRDVAFWKARSNRLVQRLFALHQDSDFYESITYGTGDTLRVNTRFSMWEKELKDAALDNP